MKRIHIAMLEEIYEDSLKMAKSRRQITGRTNDLFITLEQLSVILAKFYE
jgi:hypothetical protein